ncbi:MAG: hypothetical protein A3J28_05080 [Acidobacteria bacterium RIFCSPLOWO2_12_FULL_60_22]|nr:MAG: hypothetical protein A3J28_05080 [Acidobacteria bacterium RIFCSPLOWO2_12_FULL_60_22]
MQPITILIAVFVLSFVAGFGWRTGSVAARLVGLMLRGRRDTSRAPQRAQDASEAHRIKADDADEPARGQVRRTRFFE